MNKIHVSQIKELSYLPKQGVMEIHLHKAVLHNGFMSKTISVKCSWSKYVEKICKLRIV